MSKFCQKWKCLMHDKCLAYTFQQTELNCVLHSKTDQGQRYVRGKQTGLKKTDHILSLPEISFCSDKNRQRRCRREPKCHHVDCLRKAQEFYKSFRRLSVNFAHFPDIEWTFDGQISNSNSSGGNNIWAVDDKRRVTLENVICYYNSYNTIFIELVILEADSRRLSCCSIKWNTRISEFVYWKT